MIHGRLPLIVTALLLFGIPCRSQTTIDALEKALKDTEKQHHSIKKKQYDDFISALNSACGSMESATRLFLDCGGTVPPPENLDGKKKQEIEELTRLHEESHKYGILRHCQLLRYSFLFATDQAAPNGNREWAGWLIERAQELDALRDTALYNESCKGRIADAYSMETFFEDRNEGSWSLSNVPELYLEYILDPAREAKKDNLEKLWDLYITMKSGDARNPEQWEDVDLPWLLFMKHTDLFLVHPGDVQLTKVVEILKNNPNHPKYQEMQNKAAELLELLKIRAKSIQIKGKDSHS